MKTKFRHFANTLDALQNAGGNCIFEHALFEKITATGRAIDELTVGEFLDLHDQANSEFNAIQQRIDQRVAESNRRTLHT